MFIGSASKAGQQYLIFSIGAQRVYSKPLVSKRQAWEEVTVARSFGLVDIQTELLRIKRRISLLRLPEIDPVITKSR